MEQLRFCPACGRVLPKVAMPMRFCPGCGVRLEVAANAAREPACSGDDKPEPDCMTTADGTGPAHGGARPTANAVVPALHVARDESTGRVLAQMALPDDWRVERAVLERTGTFDCPFVVSFWVVGPAGERISYRSETCYCDCGAAMVPGLQRERKSLAGVDEACDELASACAAQLSARATYAGAQPYPVEAARDEERQRARVEREAKNEFAVQGCPNVPVEDVIYGATLRTYELEGGAGENLGLAVALKVEGYRYSLLGGLSGLGQGLAELGRGMTAAGQDVLGTLAERGLLGGVLGRRIRERQGATVPGAVPSQGSGRADTEPSQQAAGGILDWKIADCFCVTAPAGHLAAAVDEVLSALATSLRLDPELAREAMAQKQQMVLEQRQRTQMQIAQQQQQFAAWQQMHASQQAAFDSYQQAWFDRSDRQHAAVMAQSAANFSSAGAATGAASYSEAIRGVNHYTRADGTDVEVSVMADQVWENGAGDVIGTRDGFEPGFGWTELPKQ